MDTTGRISGGRSSRGEPQPNGGLPLPGMENCLRYFDQATDANSCRLFGQIRPAPEDLSAADVWLLSEIFGVVGHPKWR